MTPTNAKDVTLTGTVCQTAGHLDPQGVMGKGEEVKVNRADVVAVGLLRVYGRSGLQRLVRTTAGTVVKVSMTKQDKTARK